MVSIIVPVYNVEKYIEKCLSSLASQTYDSLEFILVSDGSKDGSDVICKRFAAADKRFRYFRKENEGVSAARNYGISRARGEYYLFVDSDDYIHPQMLELLYEAIRKGDYDLAIAYYQTVVINKKINFQSIVTPCFIDIPVQKAIIGLFGTLGEDMRLGSCWNKLYKKRVLEDIYFSKFLMSEDLFFNMRVFNRASKIIEVENVLYYYLQHEASAVHQLSKRKEEDRINVLYKCLDFLSLGSDIEACCLLKLYKTLFSTRLRVKKEIYRKDVVTKIAEIHRQICGRFFHNKHIPYFKKFLFIVLYYIPFSYQIFIIFCELKARNE